MLRVAVIFDSVGVFRAEVFGTPADSCGIRGRGYRFFNKLDGWARFIHLIAKHTKPDVSMLRLDRERI